MTSWNFNEWDFQKLFALWGFAFENEKVYTIEENSNDDMCRQKEYDINSNVICGYGTPMY